VSELERSRSTSVSTEDLLARARALSAHGSTTHPQPADRVEHPPSSQEDSESTDWLRLRRDLLTVRSTEEAVSSLAVIFQSSFAEAHDVIGLDEQTLGVYLRWAITDVAWMFADMAAAEGYGDLARKFLAVVGQPIPEDLGTWVYRVQPDVQKFIALAVNTFDPYAYEEFASWLVAMLLSFGRAWPIDLDRELPTLVDNLLGKMNGWALEPWTLGIWEDWANPWEKYPLETPKKGRVITMGACRMERCYSNFFLDLDAVTNSVDS
jgi:hypothetical protein